MKYLECFIAWTPHHETYYDDPKCGTVEIGPLPDRSGWSHGYAMTGGSCYSARHKGMDDRRNALMMVDFHTMVVRDGIDPQVAHKEFLKVDEYRKIIAPDVYGADPS